MKLSMIVCGALLMATTALAQDKQPAGAMDMSKMGPWSRKPTNEKQTKKEVADFFKAQEEIEKKSDFDGALACVDFPVYMMTDDAKGVVEAEPWTKEKYAQMMKPFWDNMPKDTKTTHKPTVTVLSDSIVNVTDDFTMTQGKTKLAGRNLSVLVKRDGKWKWKVMGEAGWGGMPAQTADATKPAEMKPEAKAEAKK